MVWGVLAAVHAEPGSALSAAAEAEFRPPAVAVASSGPAGAVGGPETWWDPLLPRRRPVTALAGGTRRAVVALAEPPEEAMESGAIASWPDLNLLARVLRGLQRMA